MKQHIWLIIVAAIFIMMLFVWKFLSMPQQSPRKPPQLIQTSSDEKIAADPNADNPGVSDMARQSKQGESILPINRAPERIAKKPFGILINPKTSPVQPERFSGYHTGTDFETFPEEASRDISVFAVCDGKIAEKRNASGYGGFLVQRCELEGRPVTVIYGHLALSSIKKQIGDVLAQGEMVGLLGAGYSADTDGERKHLHLGIHRGTTVNIRGYVSAKSALDQWIDPCEHFCGK